MPAVRWHGLAGNGRRKLMAEHCYYCGWLEELEGRLAPLYPDAPTEIVGFTDHDSVILDHAEFRAILDMAMRTEQVERERDRMAKHLSLECAEFEEAYAELLERNPALEDENDRLTSERDALRRMHEQVIDTTDPWKPEPWYAHIHPKRWCRWCAAFEPEHEADCPWVAL